MSTLISYPLSVSCSVAHSRTSRRRLPSPAIWRSFAACRGFNCFRLSLCRSVLIVGLRGASDDYFRSKPLRKPMTATTVTHAKPMLSHFSMTEIVGSATTGTLFSWLCFIEIARDRQTKDFGQDINHWSMRVAQVSKSPCFQNGNAYASAIRPVCHHHMEQWQY